MHQVLEDAPANHSRDCQERDLWPLGVGFVNTFMQSL
jgi:hypothetical protein